MSAVDDLTEPVERAGAAERAALASKWKERVDVEALPDPGMAGSVSSRAGDAGVFWVGQGLFAGAVCVVDRRELEMVSRRTDWSLQDVDRGVVLAGAVLIGIGGALGLVGLSVGSAALVAGWRHWYRRVDLAPQELARLKWEQARAAVGAGVGAWQLAEEKGYTPRRERTL